MFYASPDQTVMTSVRHLLTGSQRHNVINLSVRSFVRPLSHVTRCFEKERTDFDANWHDSMGMR